MRRILERRPSPAMVVALIALFIAMGGVSYGVATGSINSREIKNNTVKSGDLRNNDIRGKDIRRSTIGGSDVASNALKGADIDESSLVLAPPSNSLKGSDIDESSLVLDLVRGFATINGEGANGTASVLNFGGQQTATVTAQREVSGSYLVTFRANTATGGFVNVDNVDDLAIQATGENFSNASAQATSASANEVAIRVRLRTFNGDNPANEDFSVQFHARTTG